MAQSEEGSWGEYLENNPDGAAQMYGLWIHAQVVANTTETSVTELLMILPMVGDSLYEHAFDDGESGREEVSHEQE